MDQELRTDLKQIEGKFIEFQLSVENKLETGSGKFQYDKAKELFPDIEKLTVEIEKKIYSRVYPVVQENRKSLDTAN